MAAGCQWDGNKVVSKSPEEVLFDHLQGLACNKDRFVKTTKDERDARRSMATLTPQGKVLVADATGVVNDVIADVASLASLRAADRTLILQFLKSLANE